MRHQVQVALVLLMKMAGPHHFQNSQTTPLKCKTNNVVLHALYKF